MATESLEATEAAKSGGWRAYLPAIMVLSVPVALLAALFIIPRWTTERDLRVCDEAIKATLRAPATYQRVTTSSIVSTSYRIEYDAANGFGVPIRSWGYCRLDPSKTTATWAEISL